MNNNKTKCPRSTHRKNNSEEAPAKKIAQAIKIAAQSKQIYRNDTNKNSIMSKNNTKNYGILNIKNSKNQEVCPNGEKDLDLIIEPKFYPSCVFPFLGYYSY
ncbi:MAG: hypothetical protein JJE53_01705 [Candidatus Pacebacteria bacterium]|nr:hypothetical protein [Candidatus Paceibacterota bacterium]